MQGLEEFALKSLHLGRMTGVSIGVHAISDAFLLMHTGVGCKYKASSQLANHDWQVHPNRREGWTEVGDRALIKGSAKRIGPYARSWYERRKPALMAVVTSTFLEMTGEDFPAEVRNIDNELPCAAVLVPTGGFEGDLFEGYARLVLEIVKRVRWEEGQVRPKEVAILGHFFDRYEMDHIGNLQQIKVLLDGIGLRLGPVLLSGRPYGELLRAAGSEVLLQFPYARPVEEELRQATGRSIHSTDLPLGLAGTERWVRQVAQVVNADSQVVESFLQSQLTHARAQLSKLSDRWRGARVVVCADTPLAAGLCSLLVELGLLPRLVSLRDSSLGGKQAFEAVLQRDQMELPDDVEILELPSLGALRERLFQLVRDQKIEVVFGSAIELNLLSAFSSEELLQIFTRAHRHFRWPLGLEIGFPATSFHTTYATPFLGFGGAVALAQRILNLSGQFPLLLT